MSSKELPGESPTTPTGIRDHWRFLVRLGCLAGAVLCLTIGAEYGLLPLVPALSPFVAFASILAAKTIQPMLGLGIAAGLGALFRHRCLCRWMCPMGLCLDGASHLGRRLRRKPYQAPSIGRWVFALTLGGAIVGFPLFLWLDPLALFASLFLLTERQQLFAGAVPFLLFALLAVFSLLRPQAWCRGFCPLGACQDLLALMSRSVRSALRPAGDLPGRGSRGHPIARRTLFGLLAGAASSGILRIAGREISGPLRPPGAVAGLTFKGLCTRCGNCIRSCPHNIIRRETGRHGLAGILTPVLGFDDDYCREDCTVCTRVCPSGALSAVVLADKPRVRIGLARVDMNVCLLGEDRECSACMRWCPYNAISYVFSEAEYTLLPVIDAGKCNGCGACEAACPTSPCKAIRVSSNADGSRPT